MCNIHFWIIVVIIFSLASLYYINLSSFGNRVEWIWQLRTFEFTHRANGSLFYIPWIYTALVLGWEVTCLVWISSMVIMLPHVVYYTPDQGALFLNIMFLIFPLAVVFLIVMLLKWMERERKIFAEREAQHQNYMREVFKAQEKERKRISQELHDGTTQTLLALGNNIQSLLNEGERKFFSEIAQNLSFTKDSILQLSEDIRRLSLDLRPSILDNVGLVEALRWLIDQSGVDITDSRIILNGKICRLNSEVEAMIFRFVQEAINNARKHSQATELVLTLDFDVDNIRIEVCDNGKGFIIPKTINEFTTNGNLGIAGMHEKATFLGGKFDISSTLGQGTSVSIEFKP